MESCLSVQRELDKVETKFTGLHDHYSNTIEDFISSIENIRRELAEGTTVGKNHHPFAAIHLVLQFRISFTVYIPLRLFHSFETDVEQTGTGLEWLPPVPSSILSRVPFVVALSKSHFHCF